ncbi:MAG: hypothetical protein MI892_09030 [Desulfobacterales bacterium]|nr:hypothetical protein [Desulfobacterales bacterium]
MDLNTVNIEIRPRPPYEGLDLGFIMASRWFLKLWGIWLLSALPIAGISFLLFFKSPVWGVFVFWWFKPLFETPLLFWISRKVFNEEPEIRHVLKNLASILKPQLFWRLTIKRFSPSRSFFMPVMLLENMKGSEYVKRVEILARNQSAGFVLTGICFLFETALFFSALILLDFLIPETIEFSVMGLFFEKGGFSKVISVILVILAMSVTAPFYTCSGFALYLSRRTALEAWDIELNFKRLIKRKQESKQSHIVAILLACGLIFFSNVTDLKASTQERDHAKQMIEEVLNDDDFGQKKTITYWKLKDIFSNQEKEEHEFTNFFEALAKIINQIIKPIIWIACGVLVVFLFYYLAKHLGYTTVALDYKKTKPPDELFGLKITADTLPKDLLAEMAKLIEAQDFRSALSLLYRGTLYRLVFDELIDIPKSATEGECIRLVEKNTDPGKALFFKTLTGVWLKLAYGHIQPDREIIESLCSKWHGFYGQANG